MIDRAHRRAYQSEWARTHRVQINAARRGKRTAQSYKYNLKKKYGLTVDQFNEIVASQNGTCPICGKKPKKFHVDHDHATGAVRGLLCLKCNSGMGVLGDDVAILVKAIKYLRRGRWL